MSKAERKWRGFSSRAAGIVQRLNTVRADLDELHREMTAVGFGYHRSSPPAVNEWFFVMDALVMAGEGMDDDADRLDAAAGALDAADWTPGDECFVKRAESELEVAADVVGEAEVER